MVHDLTCCSSACAIELGEQVVVTGGSFSHDLVTLYNQQVALQTLVTLVTSASKSSIRSKSEGS